MSFSGPWRPLRRLPSLRWGEKVALVPAGPYSVSPGEKNAGERERCKSSIRWMKPINLIAVLSLLPDY